MEGMEKCLLLPVLEDQEIPHLDKIIMLAKNIGLRIHVAAFISPLVEVGSFISETIRLTELINGVIKKVKGKLPQISGKIYSAPLKDKLNKVVEKEKVILIATANVSEFPVNLQQISKEVMIMQLSSSRGSRRPNDILLMHKISRKYIHAIAEISALFGTKLFMVQELNNEAVEELKESFGVPEPAGLDRQARPREINEWLLKHRTGLIALNKSELGRNKKRTMEMLKSVSTPVLIY